MLLIKTLMDKMGLLTKFFATLHALVKKIISKQRQTFPCDINQGFYSKTIHTNFTFKPNTLKQSTFKIDVTNQDFDGQDGTLDEILYYIACIG